MKMDVENNMTINGGTPKEKQHLMDNAEAKKKTSIAKVPDVERIKGGTNQSWWHRRTFLEKGLFVLSTFMCVIIVVLLIFMTAKPSLSEMSEPNGQGSSESLVNSKQPSVCLTASCVKTSSRLLTGIDPAIDPCQNFFDYACGGWNRQHVLTDDVSQLDTMSLLSDALQIRLKSARLLDAIDPSVDPCEDFFDYACGAWNEKNLIPDDRSNYNTFGKLRDDLQVMLKSLLEEEVNPADPEAITNTKYLYQSCLNLTRLEERGDQPLRDLIKLLGGWPVLDPDWNETSFDWLKLMADLRLLNNRVLINQWVSADDKNSDVNIIQLDQTQLGMPSRDYFLKSRDDAILMGYQQFAVDVAMLLGATKERAQEEIRQLVDLEIQLANVTMPAEMRRDTEAIYHKMTVADLYADVSQDIDWLRYLNLIFANVSMNVSMEESIVVYTPTYLRSLAYLVRTTPKRTLANYLVWFAIYNSFKSDPFPSQFQAAKTNFNKVFYGTDSERARWRTCVTYVNDNFGMALGRMFVSQNFDEQAKHTAMEMIGNIRDSFSDLLKEVEWMDDTTKEKAREKANVMQEKIGYPDYIMNDTALNEHYDGVEIDPHMYFENVLNNLNVVTRNHLKNLRKPVDKEKWSTTPTVVNAFYSATKNQIMFPASILQPPFYDELYPKSLTFGGIGMVIGHEITHGFDDEGRQFDKNGNLQQWWSDSVIEKFKERAQCIVDQYSNYTVTEVNLNINGRQTQGENIADNGGLKQSFRAYRKWVDSQGKEEDALPGINLTHNQLFFLNFAQIWCGSARPESYIQAIRSGRHSPGRFRVIGSLSNSYDFAEAYNCPVGSPMNPRNKCSVW